MKPSGLKEWFNFQVEIYSPELRYKYQRLVYHSDATDLCSAAVSDNLLAEDETRFLGHQSLGCCLRHSEAMALPSRYHNSLRLPKENSQNDIEMCKCFQTKFRYVHDGWCMILVWCISTITDKDTII